MSPDNANNPISGSPGAAPGPPALDVPHNQAPGAPAPAPLAPPAAPAATPPAAPPPPAPPAAGEDLNLIKQQAMQNLEPLMDKLEQTPDEKFKTTMMMITATSNPHLIKMAYDAASQIKDDKARAQALLQVINSVDQHIQQTRS